MLISPTKKRLDDLYAQLRELRSKGSPPLPLITEEEKAIQEEIKVLTQQLNEEQNSGPAVLKG